MSIVSNINFMSQLPCIKESQIKAGLPFYQQYHHLLSHPHNCMLKKNLSSTTWEKNLDLFSNITRKEKSDTAISI